MLADIWQQIWSNKYIRYAFIGFAALVVAALILRQRMAILNFWDRTFKGAAFDDPYSWAGDIYGFEEDKVAAHRLYITGLKEVIERAYEIYNIDEPDELFKKEPVDLPAWHTAINADAYTQVSKLFADVGLFCRPMLNDSSLTTQFQREELLKQRHLKKSENNNPFNYAVTADNINSNTAFLREVDQNYLALALQKKPDSLEVIRFRERLLASTCRPVKAHNSWQKALDYIEFKEEKKLVLETGGVARADYKALPDSIYQKLFSRLSKDKTYLLAMKEFFKRSYNSTGNLEWKLNQSWANFALVDINDKKAYLVPFLESTLQKSRVSSMQTNRQIFNDLFSLKYPAIETKPIYVYTLAETAFRARNLKLATGTTGLIQSKALCNNILKQGLYSTPTDARRVRRLLFMLNLLGY